MYLVNSHILAQGGYDADAQAFLTATGIVDVPQSDAINDFVVALKTAGIWSKMKYIYPFVGGSATTHKFNLKDPRDLDAAFRLTFAAAITHGANGITSTGITATNVVDTKFVPSAELADVNFSFGQWAHTGPNQTGAPNSQYCGSTGSMSNAAYRFQRTSPTTNATTFQFGGSSGGVTLASLTSFISVSNNSPNAQRYENGATIGATFGTGTAVLSDRAFYLMRHNNNGSTTGTCAFTLKFAYLSTYLDGTEMLALYNAASALQTVLGR